MIHSLAKYYRLSPAKARRLTEMDFWQMRAFDELDASKTEYLLKLRTD